MAIKIRYIILSMFLFVTHLLHAANTKMHDTQCLAMAIFHEAGGEPRIGQLAVGRVIINRVHAGMASSVCGVIHQRHQFTFRATAIPHGRAEYFLSMATKLLSGDSDGIHFPSQMLYFNNHPMHHKKIRLYRIIGHQRFYILV